MILPKSLIFEEIEDNFDNFFCNLEHKISIDSLVFGEKD